jgi:hypothetical protein
MKKLYYILLLFAGIANAQMSFINSPSPTPLQKCDDNQDQFTSFDLTTKTLEIIDLVTPTGDYSVVYFESEMNAQLNTNPIVDLANYYNINPAMQTVYFRIVNNSNPNDFLVSGLSLVVNPLPLINPVISDYYVSDSPYDGIAVFDLTSKAAEINFGLADAFETYYPSLAAAQAGTSPIPNPVAFMNNVNPQTIGVRVENAATGCYQVGSFQLIVSDGIPVVTPSVYSICDTGNDTTETFDLTTKIGEILGNLNPTLYTVNFHTTAADAVNDVNPITPINSYVSTVSNQTLYVRVYENANPANFATTSLELKIVPMPIGIMSAPASVCQGELAIVTFQAQNSAPPYSFYYNINGVAAGTASASLGNTVSLYINTAVPGAYTYELIGVSSQNEAFCYNPQSDILTVQVQAAPELTNPAPNILVQDIPYDGTATFNLTTNENTILTGQTGATIVYYTSQYDAQAQTNPIANPTAYTATSGQSIWFRLDYAGGCPLISSFYLYTTNPNIVFIPDPNFKARLLAADGATQFAQNLSHNFTVIDTNGDGEIQYTEAANISYLNASQANIGDFTGLEAFVNITSLNTGYNYAATGINVTTMPLLQDLSTSHCAFTNLNLALNHQLTSLSCEYNNLLSLDLSANPLLTFLHCQNNHLVDLNLEGLTVLTDVVASNNQITAVYTTDLHSIQFLSVDSNAITALDLTGLNTLQQLNCQYNQIDSLSTADCPNLSTLSCAGNQMSYLDTSNSPLLFFLDCNSNSFISLDLSQNNQLCGLNCSNNNFLSALNIKNGVDNCYTNFNVQFNYNLQQFCCDDNEMAYFQNIFTLDGINVNVNSYCSFTPGGNYNTITGHIAYDANNNGCDAADDIQPNVRVNINDGTTQGASFTNGAGNYSFYTQAGSFTLTPDIENPTWFNFSPTTATIPFADANNNAATQNFCITANGAHQDLEMVMAPLTPARPGFNAVYKLVYRNKGNTIMGPSTSGIILSYNTAKLTYVSSSQPVTATGTNSVNFTYPQLLPFASGSIEVTFHVNAPTDTPAVNIGDELQFMTMISPNNLDENIPDNTFNYTQTVVGSFDPNDITCMEGPVVSPNEIGKYLHYMINFENTGTYQAENIVVKEMIDTNMYDLNSLQVLNSSAAVTTKITGNKAEFIFQNINLDSGGHGNILIKIKSKDTLVQGDAVAKQANIYFDYNFPITTNEATTVFQLLSNPSFPTDSTISLYPNPTHNVVNIKAKNTITSVQLFDVQGRLLETKLVNENDTTLDITTQSAGVYFIKATTDKGIRVERIVKE